MTTLLPEKRLKHVSESLAAKIENWKEGVSLFQASGQEIDEILKLASVDRWKLGVQFNKHANRMMLIKPVLYRSTITRFYYSMYHCLRACAFIFYSGDDYQAHSTLPTKIPDDFDPSENWKNILKDARELRNRVDYEPYPKSIRILKTKLTKMKIDSDRLTILSRSYLRSKGCVI